ncbi:MAG: carboxypeptidase-like regulatory domain-containing protein [Methanoregula sp.]|nr:carboxypeptidase-like regulatory domain-containing protein [Methanoregula sp.]
MTLFPYFGKKAWIIVVILVFSLTYTVSAVTNTNSVTVVVKDSKTRENLDDVQVYLDGGYRGITSSADGDGTLVLRDVSPGTHTLRVTCSGFKEVTKKIVTPAESNLEIYLSKGSLVSLNPNGPKPNAINIIFYPSSTSYNCAEHVKVATQTYMSNETRFREDVTNLISHTYLNLDTATSPSNPLPVDYKDHFNFYYYFDPASPADAFSGCAGTVPENYWNDVTFSDITIILYPTYYGVYADASCQPTGCTQDFGPGRNLMKAPANLAMIFKHESGHGVFGLIDTYCGTTYYYQNDPNPNVWSSLDACKANARANNRDPEQCRQIQKTSAGSSSCVKNFWNWDPQPDIMAGVYGGKFGDAATQRINYVMTQSGAE